jgi:hypothetical protein
VPLQGTENKGNVISEIKELKTDYSNTSDV